MYTGEELVLTVVDISLGKKFTTIPTGTFLRRKMTIAEFKRSLRASFIFC
jgi:hypothetical protein